VVKLFRWLKYPGVKIDPTSRLGKFLTIEPGCSIGKESFIGNGCVLRKGTSIGDNTLIGHLTVFEGGGTYVGNNCLIHSQCHITRQIIIEDFVFIAPMFVGANDPVMCHGRRDICKWTERPYRICRGARIAINVTVLPGITIGANSVIGAGAVVTKNIPPCTKWRGVPAVQYGEVPEKEWL